MVRARKNQAKDSVDPTNRDYERLGRIMETIFVGGYMSRRKLFWVSFLRGAFFGSGAALGSTLLVIIVVWVLSFFTELPFLGRFIEALNNALDRQIDT